MATPAALRTLVCPVCGERIGVLPHAEAWHRHRVNGREQLVAFTEENTPNA